MKILGITANIDKERACDAIKLVCEEAEKQGFSVVLDRESAKCAGPDIEVSDSFYESAEAILALGGDGTMLRVARELNGLDCPVLGINIGNLGFLTSVNLKDVGVALNGLADGAYNLSERHLAECSVSRAGAKIGDYTALNDVVITNASPSRVVTLDVAVGTDEGTSFVGDGLIVCTPSGSTGHSLSSGGPIVHPEVHALAMSPICPQTLSSRPMVIPADSTIHITVENSSGQVMLTMDGQVSLPLETGDRIGVGVSSKTVKFVQMQDYSYFSVLRRKLHWNLSNRVDADS